MDDAIALEIRMEVARACEAIKEAAWAMNAPHVRMRPSVVPDGNQWCALYGTNIQEGVCGFGDTPEAACQEFDKAWVTERAGGKA